MGQCRLPLRLTRIFLQVGSNEEPVKEMKNLKYAQ